MSEKILNFLKRLMTRRGPSQFSDFFLNASDRQKKKLFTDVARLANKDQKELFERSLQRKSQ